jgi:hypothetical protein
MKYIILAIIAVLALTACTTAVTQEETAPVQNTEEVVVQDNSDLEPTVEVPKASSNHDIEIISGRLDPREVTIPVGVESNIVVHNKQEYSARVDIQFTGNTQSVTVAPGQYEVITVSPDKTGIAAIQLNNQQLGTVFVE